MRLQWVDTLLNASTVPCFIPYFENDATYCFYNDKFILMHLYYWLTIKTIVIQLLKIVTPIQLKTY